MLTASCIEQDHFSELVHSASRILTAASCCGQWRRLEMCTNFHVWPLIFSPFFAYCALRASCDYRTPGSWLEVWDDGLCGSWHVDCDSGVPSDCRLRWHDTRRLKVVLPLENKFSESWFLQGLLSTGFPAVGGFGASWRPASQRLVVVNDLQRWDTQQLAWVMYCVDGRPAFGSTFVLFILRRSHHHFNDDWLLD